MKFLENYIFHYKICISEQNSEKSSQQLLNIYGNFFNILF